jgi:DNA-binding transcriptional ArsR family regulator
MTRNDYLSNVKAKEFLQSYEQWKDTRLNEPGWFPIFIDFKESELLKNISGNALRLYIYLGLHSKNSTGESWHSLSSMAKYFGKSERTISNWLEELKYHNLVERIQLDRSTTAVTFLRPYGVNNKGEGI